MNYQKQKSKITHLFSKMNSVNKVEQLMIDYNLSEDEKYKVRKYLATEIDSRQHLPQLTADYIRLYMRKQI